MGSIQFNTSDIILGGTNIMEATQSEDQLHFNESYTVIGEKLKASTIVANYDLTVLGDVEADEINVSGNFYIIGNVKAKKISCYKTILCTGEINADEISSSDVISNNITSKKLESAGDIINRDAIDIKGTIKAEGDIISGGGIVGNGNFSAQNAVAVEYFSFDGDIKGKVLELESGTIFGEESEQEEPQQTPSNVSVDSISLETLTESFQTVINAGIKESGAVDEEALMEYVNKISKLDDKSLSDWSLLLNNLVEISYYDEITNLRDYLYIVIAKKNLPRDIIEYETIEHVFKKLLVEADKKLTELPFHAKDTADFVFSVKIALQCENELKMSQADLLNRIFESIGLKYSTALSFLG